MRNRIFPVVAGAVGLLAVLAGSAQAQGIVYDNTTTFTGQAFVNGGATSVVTGSTIVADRLVFAPGVGGGIISTFTFSVANLNAANVSARPRVRFWQANGTGGAPGTLIAGFSFNAITFTAGTSALFTGNIAASNIAIPANGQLWAGIFFDDPTSTLTTAQLNNLGQGLFNPPTVGSSADSHWTSAAPGSNLVNNPAGTVTTTPFGAAAVANYGWRFTTVAPEPGSLALLALGGLGAAGILRRRKSA